MCACTCTRACTYNISLTLLCFASHSLSSSWQTPLGPGGRGGPPSLSRPLITFTRRNVRSLKDRQTAYILKFNSRNLTAFSFHFPPLGKTFPRPSDPLVHMHPRRAALRISSCLAIKSQSIGSRKTVTFCNVASLLLASPIAIAIFFFPTQTFPSTPSHGGHHEARPQAVD